MPAFGARLPRRMERPLGLAAGVAYLHHQLLVPVECGNFDIGQVRGRGLARHCHGVVME